MRPVKKRPAPKSYSHYRAARNDLCEQIGWYCSYCEMLVTNMIEVEHVIPVHNGGGELDWDNFLLSCRYCNGCKNDGNTSRAGYYWPDSDNTFRAFKYQEGLPIQSADGLAVREQQIADATIHLYGLNREQGTASPPTLADTRWFHRGQAWQKANRSLNRWKRYPVPDMSEQIVDQAVDCGFFSIWMEVFKSEQVIRKKLIEAFSGTDITCFDCNTLPVKRANGML